MKLTQYAVHRRLATTAIIVALVVLGAYGLMGLPVDFLPSVTYPMIRVHIWWRGATPDEIDKNIADPLERQMATVDDLDYLESSSIEGMYTLLVNFKYGVNVDVAYQDALAAMARVSRDLPNDIDPPIMIKADPSQLPVLQLTISSDQWDLVQLRTWVDEWLQDQLLAVPGVAGTEIVGGLKREIRVHLDADALEKYGLNLPGVLKRLREENIEQFGGRVTTGPKEVIARTVGEYKTLNEIRGVLLTREGQAKVYLGDVAEVLDLHEEARVITRLDGNPCVKLSVLKQASANTVSVARDVAERITELAPSLPDGVRMGMVENQADYVGAALTGVRNAAFQAAVLVILIIWIFVGSWRQVLVMVVAIPLTLILNFGLMRLSGFSLNIFSLGGLVIAIGVLLSNSIVVIENITRWRHDRLVDGGAPPDAPTMGRISVEATAEVATAVLAATLSFLALFVPFLLVPGLVSLLFRELILVIAGIVVISLVVALTVTPMLMALVFGKAGKHRGLTRFDRFFDRLTEVYLRLLQAVLRWKWAAIAVFVLILGGAVLLAGQLGSEFLPQMDDGRIMVKVRLPTGASLAETDKVLSRLEAVLGDDDRIESMFTLSGGKVWGLYTYEIANEGELNIQLVPRSRRTVSTSGYLEEIRPLMQQVPVPGGMAMVMQMRLRGIRNLGDADIEVKIKGQDIDRLFDLARQTAGVMNSLDSFTNVYVSMDLSKPEYQILIDRDRAAELGVSVSDVSETVRSLVTGAIATKYRDGDEYYNIRAMIPESKITSRRDLENIPVINAKGGYLRLADVAQVVQAVGPVEINREDQVKQVVIRGDAAGVSVGQALAELRSQIDIMERPLGYDFGYGGRAQMMTDMKQTVLSILVFALFFAFIVLAVQFDSLRLPTLILGSIPFCLAGLVFIMFLSGLPLGATVIIGVLVIVAATVNDGVLLLEFAREIQTREGVGAQEAVLQAARIRLRPLVMTTVCTLVGFIPLALAIEEGGDMLQPMAVAAIGGLAMEIIVVLFLMPCLYVLGSTKSQPKETV